MSLSRSPSHSLALRAQVCGTTDCHNCSAVKGPACTQHGSQKKHATWASEFSLLHTKPQPGAPASCTERQPCLLVAQPLHMQTKMQTDTAQLLTAQICKHVAARMLYTREGRERRLSVSFCLSLSFYIFSLSLSLSLRAQSTGRHDPCSCQPRCNLPFCRVTQRHTVPSMALGTVVA
jgi:hypothetical protein